MADVKTIKVPKPLGNAGGPQYTFQDFMAWLINTQPKFLQDGMGIRLAMRVEKKLEELSKTIEERVKANPMPKAEEGVELDPKALEEWTTLIWENLEMTFDEVDQKTLHESAEKPTGTYPIQPARRLLDFIDALACKSEAVVKS